MDDIISKNMNNPLIFLRKWLLIHVFGGSQGLHLASKLAADCRLFAPDIIISQVYKGCKELDQQPIIYPSFFFCRHL